MNIADFLLLDDWEKLVIVEIQIARQLHEATWTQHGTYTNVWYIALADDGEIVRVEEDGSEYTEKFSISDCNGTASSFYYDEFNKTLYVRTSGSDDPASETGGEPDYNIVAFWWEYFSNRPKQFEPSEDILSEANGSLEFWTSSTNAEEWTEYTEGSSTITQESTIVYDSKSAYSAKLTGDGSNNAVQLYRSVLLPPQRKVKVRFQHKESTSGKTIYLMIKDTGGNVFLNNSLEWQTSSANITVANSTSWAEKEIEFITHADYSQYYIVIFNHDLTSASAYIDNVEVLRCRREIDCHICFPDGGIPVISQAVGNYSQPDERLAFGSIRLNNVDGWFYSRRQAEGYLWHGQDIRFRVGYQTEAYADIALFFAGITRKPLWGNIVEIGIKDERGLLKTIPDDFFDEDTYPAIESEWKGKRIPYLLGQVEDIKPPEIDTEYHIYKPSKAVFDREVEYTWYLDEDCADLSDWTEVNLTGFANTSQMTFNGKSCFQHKIEEDTPSDDTYTRIYRDVGTLPDSFTFEIRMQHYSNFGPLAENRHIEIELWNGSIKFYARIDNNSIDVYDGASWGENASTNSEKVWYTYKFVIDGSSPGSETVDIYRNGALVVSGEDCSNADATNDGKIQITVSGDEEVDYTIHYTDFIRAYVENVISAGTTMGIQAIDAVYKTTGAGVKTTLTPSTDYTTDLNNGEFTVSASLSEGDIITCDAQGLKCDFEDSSYAYLLADFLYFLYVTLNQVSKYRLDMPSLLDLKTNRVLAVGKWLSEETPSLDFLIEMKRSGIFQTYLRPDRKIVFHRYSSDIPSDAPHFYNEDFVEKPIEEEDTDQCYKYVCVRSCYKPYGGYYEYEESDFIPDTEWNHKKKGTLTLDTILSTQFQARDLRDNILEMVKSPPSTISMVLKSAALLLNPTDKIYITYEEKDSDGNAISIFDEEVVRILEIEKDLNMGHVRITAMKDNSDFSWTIT